MEIHQVLGRQQENKPYISCTTVKGIEGATGITLTSDSNVVVIAGPDLTGKQNSLTVGIAAGAELILSGTTVKGVKSGTGIKLTSDSNVVTIACPYLPTKQNPCIARTTAGAQAMLSGTTLKGSKAGAGMIPSSDSNVVTTSPGDMIDVAAPLTITYNA